MVLIIEVTISISMCCDKKKMRTIIYLFNSIYVSDTIPALGDRQCCKTQDLHVPVPRLSFMYFFHIVHFYIIPCEVGIIITSITITSI